MSSCSMYYYFQSGTNSLEMHYLSNDFQANPNQKMTHILSWKYLQLQPYR